MKKLLFAVLATATLAACTQEELVSINKGDAITFDNAFIDNATRAAIDGTYTTNTLNEFEVYATITTPEGGVANIFEGEKVVKGGTGTGDAWTYDANNTQYWIEGNTYDFRAVADGNVSGVTEAVVNANGLLTGVELFDVTAQKDILFAEQMNVTYAGGAQTVKFTFDHLLAKVKFTFKNTISTNNGYTYKVTNVKINETAKNGVYTIGAGWAEAASRENTSLAFGNGAATSDAAGADATAIAYASSVESNWERLLVPSNEARNITFTTELLKNDVVIDTKDRTVNTNVIELEEGGAYNFVISLGNPGEPIKFDVEKVNDWDETASQDFSYEVTTGAIVVNNANGLQTVMAGIADGTFASDSNIVLGTDIDLSAPITRAAVESNWVPVGTEEKPFTGTFDGNGHTIKNLTIVESEAKEGKAYIGFFGYAKNAEIKNVIFENVTLDIACLDIDHSQGHIGAVAGSLEGTSTIENVTVKGDIKVSATQSANGASRVAVVAGGNSYGNVTMKNVHVIANEGSYLIANNNTGALAGQLQGKNVFENCSSNINVTVNKFFAGGIIGLAAGDSMFTDCHTTGDIAVVAGREGRAHDQYRVGGIAGGWADNTKTPCVLIGCSYTGAISGKNSDGSVANPLDYAGYVGRGYTLNGCQGSKVVIDNVAYVQSGNTAATAGQYDIIYTVANAEDFAKAMEVKAKTIILANDVTLAENYRLVVKNALTIDLGGYALKGSNSATATHNFFIDVNGGTLNVSNGTIEYTHTGDNMAWSGATTNIDVTAGGVLNLNGVEVINKGGTDMNFAVHMNNWGEVTVNAEDCSFEAPYCGFRVFNSGYDNNNVTISNSTFTGNNRAFWVHNYLGDLNSAQHSDDAIKARLKFDIFGKGNTFTTKADAISPIRYGFGNTVYINPENGQEITNVVKNVEELKDVLVAAGSAGAGDTEINIAPGEYTMPADWTPITVDGYHGADIVTINGNGAVLKGMTQSLFDGGFAGGSGIVIKNLTIENAAIVANNNQGYGAFVNCADSMAEITLINCHLINSTITTPNEGADESRIGGLVGWTSGYSNVNDGPVKTYVTIKNCSVVGCTIKGAGSIGGICGHAGASDWTYTTIENCVVENNTLISTDAGSWRVGVAVGTANVGEVVINNLTESNNTLAQGDLTDSYTGARRYAGRLALGTTGKFVVDGVEIK